MVSFAKTGHTQKEEAMQAPTMTLYEETLRGELWEVVRSTSRPYRERKKVTRTYSSLYGPTLRSIGTQKQRQYSAMGRGADVYYFLYDINRDGIKELVVLDRTYGMSGGMVYTVKKSGSQLVSSYVDAIGGGQHYVYHAQSQSLIMAYSGPGGYAYYRVGISGGRVTTAEIASYRSDQQSQLPDYGSPLTEYDVVRDGFLSIDYTALSRAGSVSVSV